MPLTDEQWSLVRPLLESAGPQPDPSSPQASTKRRPGRPPGRPAADTRTILDGILWKLSYRLPWRRLPSSFGSYQACYQYYLRWRDSGLLRPVIRTLLADVETRGGFNFRAAYDSGQVYFRELGTRFEIYVLPIIASSWQFQTALLYYQYAIGIIERKRSPVPVPLNPMEKIFKDWKPPE